MGSYSAALSLKLCKGEAVAAGQVLMRMDTKLSSADGAALATEIEQRRLQLRRIDAELAGEASLAAAPDDPPQLARQVEAQFQANRQAQK